MEIKNVKKIQIRKSRFNYESESEYYSSCKNHESESEYSGFGEKDSNPNPNPNIRYNTVTLSQNNHLIIQFVTRLYFDFANLQFPSTLYWNWMVDGVGICGKVCKDITT